MNLNISHGFVVFQGTESFPSISFALQFLTV